MTLPNSAVQLVKDLDKTVPPISPEEVLKSLEMGETGRLMLASRAGLRAVVDSLKLRYELTEQPKEDD